MNEQDKVLLLIIYVISTVTIFYYIYKSIKKKNGFKMIDFFNIYYSIVFFLVPIFSIYNNSKYFTLKYGKYMNYGLRYHIISFIAAMFLFLIVNIVYKRKKIIIKNEKDINISTKSFFWLNIFFSLLGILSYYMWSKIYGFPFGILKYADLLRDGYVVVHNPYTIMQPFCNFCSLSAYMWLIYYDYIKKISLKIIARLFFIITFFFAVLSALATDGRMAIIVTFLVPIIYYINNKKISIIKIIIIGLISLYILANLDNYTYFIRHGEFKKNYNSHNNHISTILSDEFGFTYSNRINIIYNIEQQKIEYTEISDLKNIAFTFVPKSKRPASLISLGEYNTSMYDYSSGIIPTDIVTAGIYKGNIFGLVFLSIFVGIMIKFFDCFFESKKSDFNNMIYTIICVTITLRIVAYYDMSEILFGRISLIIYYILFLIICSRRLENENN